MPKQRITREMIVEAAFDLAREGGMEQVLVKNIAERLGCSVQPIYSYCANMEELRRDVQKCAADFMSEYALSHADKEDFFHSIGKSYLLLAKEEPYLYEISFLRKRSGTCVNSLDELYEQECSPKVAEFIAKNYELSLSAAKRLHLNMVIYNAGIGSMMLASNFGISLEELDLRMSEANEVFLEQARKETLEGR